MWEGSSSFQWLAAEFLLHGMMEMHIVLSFLALLLLCWFFTLNKLDHKDQQWRKPAEPLMSCQALLVGQDFGIWPWHDGVIASSGGVLLLQASRRMAVLQHVQRIQTPGRASCDPSPAHVAWQRQIQAYCKSWLHAFLHPSILGAKWGWTSGRRVHAVMMLSSPLFDGWLYAGFFHSRSLTLSFSFCFLFILEKVINIFAVSHGAFRFLPIFFRSYFS